MKQGYGRLLDHRRMAWPGVNLNLVGMVLKNNVLNANDTKTKPYRDDWIFRWRGEGNIPSWNKYSK